MLLCGPQQSWGIFQYITKIIIPRVNNGEVTLDNTNTQYYSFFEVAITLHVEYRMYRKYGTTNSQHRTHSHTHTLIDLQASPVQARVISLSSHECLFFSHVRTFSKCVTHEYTRCLVARQGCLQPHIAIDVALGTYSALILLLVAYMP